MVVGFKSNPGFRFLADFMSSYVCSSLPTPQETHFASSQTWISGMTVRFHYGRDASSNEQPIDVNLCVSFFSSSHLL